RASLTWLRLLSSAKTGSRSAATFALVLTGWWQPEIIRSRSFEAIMASTEKRNLERVRYWQGQMLRSRDFNDIHATEEQRRWWHNRALHDAYGIYQDPPLARDPNAESHFLARLSPHETPVTVTAGL